MESQGSPAISKNLQLIFRDQYKHENKERKEGRRIKRKGELKMKPEELEIIQGILKETLLQKSV